VTTEELALEVETRVDAPRDVVFAYFTDPEKYRRWKGTRAELDPRPGGGYRVQMGSNGWVAGEYVLVDPPNRIVFTWGWEDDPAVPPGTTRVEVTFVPDGDATIVRLRHSGFTDGMRRDQHEQGWRHFLSRLAVAGAGGDAGPDSMFESPG
jgi:uncharacterized protein YndB with AHSA1/START domain